MKIIKISRFLVRIKKHVLIWEGRIAGRINFETLKSNYEDGGMQLYDLEIRRKILRTKWLHYLSGKTSSDIERYLADNLIGKYREIAGLNILKHNTPLNKYRSIDKFYLNSIKAWRDMVISWQAVNINSIRDEVIYDNTLLTGSSNRTFPFFNVSNRQRHIPMFFKDLPITVNPTHIAIRNRPIISQINHAYWNLRYNKLGQVNTSGFYKQINEQTKLFGTITFKCLYKQAIAERGIDKIWENKWNTLLRFYTLDIDVDEWNRIWCGIHDRLYNFELQSTIWEIIHLNFYCGYKERIMSYGDGKCKLCGEVEQGSHHIIFECYVLKASIELFMHILTQLSDIELSNDELVFGLVALPSEELDAKCKLRNLVTFVIRHCVFRSRAIEFTNRNSAIRAMKNKIKYKLNEFLTDKWLHFKYKVSENEFKKLYLVEDILGKIENNKLIVSFNDI